MTNQTYRHSYSAGVGIFSLIAFYISAILLKNSIGWVILHTILGLPYVLYYALFL